MRNTILTLLSICLSGSLAAQSGEAVTQCGTPTGQKAMPLVEYKELPNPIKADAKAWSVLSGDMIGWGSTDVRYSKEVAYNKSKETAKTLTAWRGERVSAQFVISAKEALNDVTYKISDFVNARNKSVIGSDAIYSGFVRYVMTDEANEDGESACGVRTDHTKWDSTLVADPIDQHLKSLSMPAMTSNGVWVRVWVPQSVESGAYKGTIDVLSGGKLLKKLTLTINVIDRTLPMPDQWAYHLDLWQNPFSIARYHGTELWSKEHFDAMRPYMKMINDMGVKVITTSIMHWPWNAQTYDPYETMVTWVKKADGTWWFDYTVFDKWVEFAMECGITEQIACYSMIPWRLSYQYFDQATNTLKFSETKPGDAEFADMWGSMLKSFAAHLKEKGWFDKTCISIDERPLDVMQKTFKVIRSADKDFKVSLAGSHHKELMGELYDYSINQRARYTEQEKAMRKELGLLTTYYTCCAEAYPNNFTFSPPSESEWLALHAAKENLDGYLRWNTTHWPKEPLLDSRFDTWAGGDTYIIYPGARSSIRVERMNDGAQSFEKIRILRDEFSKNGDKKSLDKLNDALKQIDEKILKTDRTPTTVTNVHNLLNSL
ncbi:MAG: DUF4091 domain-containing protein [Rikenellaceae bacterium]